MTCSKILNDENTALRTATDIVSKVGADTGITEDALLTAAKYFNTADGAVDARMLVGKMLANQFIKAQKWMANHFEIEPNSAWIRWTDLVKSAQGLVLLDLNPTYLMQNILDNQLKLVREGMGFTRYAHLYFPNRSKRLAERVFGKGMIPERFTAGFGGEYGQQTVDAISAAQKVKKAGIPEALAVVSKQSANSRLSAK